MIPQRIASLLASSTEMLYGLGLGQQVVAVSHECDYPPEAAIKPRVTRTRIDAQADSRQIEDQVRAMLAEQAALYEIDTDKLVELAPDLIVTQAQCDVCAVRYEDVVSAVRTHPALSDARVVALNPLSLEDIFSDIIRVGESAGCTDAAREYVGRLQNRVEAIRVQTATLPAESLPRVACIEWIDPLMIAGNWMPELIELAGGRGGLTTPGVHSPYVNWDQLLAFDPEVVVIMPCGFDLERTLQEAPQLAAQPEWPMLRAVQEGRVFAVDGNAYFNRSGPRMVDSLEILAHMIHPRIFPPPHNVVWEKVAISLRHRR